MRLASTSQRKEVKSFQEGGEEFMGTYEVLSLMIQFAILIAFLTKK
jgi:hypothetical protein